MYTIKDIIIKLIDIENYASNIYNQISQNSNKEISNFKILCNVMAKEEMKHVEYFTYIKENISEEENIDIDFFVYDKISELLFQFENRIKSVPQISKMSALIDFIINFEKDNVALLIDIQGKLVQNSNYEKSDSYKILSKLIEEEKNHVRQLEPYAK